MLDAVIDINDNQKVKLIPKIEAYFDGNLEGKTIAMWGLAFKPETDDIREDPPLYIINALLEKGARVQALEPEAMDNVKARYKDKITFAETMYAATEGADALVISTEWSIFRTPNFTKLRDNLKESVIFDGRNLYDVEDMEKEGFTYISIGRKEV